MTRGTGLPRAFRFGVNCVTTSLQELQETARAAEASGFATLIAQDHFGAQFGPLPALVAAGAVTTSLRLATMVLDNDFRHPAVVAKDAATVDVLTSGRLELGLGAGWLQSDYAKSGIAYDSASVRMTRLAEAVQIVKACLADSEPVSFVGQHYTIDRLDPLPRPVQQPRPPIMIGGRQRRMLGLAARDADIVGLSLLDPRGPGAPPVPTFAQKVAWVREAAGERFDALELHVNAGVVAIGSQGEVSPALEAAAARTGINVDEVRASPGALVGSVDDVVDKLQAQREQYGVSYYVVQTRFMRALAPVVARLA